VSQSGIIHVGGSAGPSIDTINGVGPVPLTGNLTLNGVGGTYVEPGSVPNTVNVGMAWEEITVAGPTLLQANHGYIINTNLTTVADLTLPAGVLGDVIEITNVSPTTGTLANGFSMAISGALSVIVGPLIATSTVTSDTQGDSIKLVCCSPGAAGKWTALYWTGSLLIF